MPWSSMTAQSRFTRKKVKKMNTVKKMIAYACGLSDFMHAANNPDQPSPVSTRRRVSALCGQGCQSCELWVDQSRGGAAP
eukprot:1850967-Prymnesium_polylepis.2